MAASIVHIPLAPMTLEINAGSSEYVTWTYRWKNVDLSADFETYSQHFGHPDGWVWKMLFQQNVDPHGNRVYGIFLYVVMADNELQDRAWNRDIRYLQFAILNAEGRQLKDKNTAAMYRENQLSWGFPGLLDNNILIRDPVVQRTGTVDIVCRLRYHQDQEKMRRPLSPTMPGGLLAGSLLGNSHPAARATASPGSYWDQKACPIAPVDPVGKAMRKLLNNSEFSDLEMVVGRDQQVFYGHKAILAARSDWFRTALKPGFREAREGRIRMEEDDPRSFEQLLEFLYTGEYPLPEQEVEPLRAIRSLPPPEPIHLSPRSPPHLPGQGGDVPMQDGNSFEYLNSNYSDAEVAAYTKLDERRYALFLLADKYGVSELKTVIRMHLTNDLLDLSNNLPPGQRLLRLIRFAFEELPESIRPMQHRDSGVGSSLASPLPAAFGHNYNYQNPVPTTQFSVSDLENREGTASAFGTLRSHSAAADNNEVGSAMDQRRSVSSTSNRVSQHDGEVYGRDNETALLRESIALYVSKMFHAVRQLEGFDEILREGGEMGDFIKMVMDHMARP